MVFNNFHLKLVSRVLLLCITLFFLNYFIVEEYYLRSVYFGLFAFIEVIELTWFLRSFTTDVKNFFTTIIEQDFTLNFKDSASHINGDLYTSMNKIMEAFKKLRNEKELQHQYLETLISHIRIGIVSYQDTSKVHLVNKAFLELVNKVYLSDINQLDANLKDAIVNLQPGERSVIKLQKNTHVLNLALQASVFKLNNVEHKLISAQDITNELNANELDAWHKLIRVLTHEIMNSITPIISLSHTLHNISKHESENGSDSWKTVNTGIEAIMNRSEGLQTFTKRYREFSQVPAPVFKEVNVKKLVEETLVLLQADLNSKNISVKIAGHDVLVLADSHLLQQVLINLFVNAIEAMEESIDPALEVELFTKGGRCYITIADNGIGFDDDVLSKVFIPFFTTKPSGSGIGLALARQIIWMHKGELVAAARQPQGAVFTIII